jgi:hypothetical protein
MDYRNPDYTDVIARRGAGLAELKKNPEMLAALRMHYATSPWDFVSDWGMAVEPRNIERGLLPQIPFVLWDRQVEYMQWVYVRWQSGEREIGRASCRERVSVTV